MHFSYIWTDGTDKDFSDFSLRMEAYYNQMVGGAQNRKSFIPYNAPDDIHDVLIVYDAGMPIACAGMKEYDAESAEIKRVWVEEAYRGRHIAGTMMAMLERCAREKGYRRMILQTRETCTDAVGLYQSIGYRPISNYPPYDTMELAVCYGKEL